MWLVRTLTIPDEIINLRGVYHVVVTAALQVTGQVNKTVIRGIPSWAASSTTTTHEFWPRLTAIEGYSRPPERGDVEDDFTIIRGPTVR